MSLATSRQPVSSGPGNGTAVVRVPGQPLASSPTGPAGPGTKPKGDPAPRPGSVFGAVGNFIRLLVAIPIGGIAAILWPLKALTTLVNRHLVVRPREALAVQMLNWLPNDLAKRALPAAILPIAGSYPSLTQSIQSKIDGIMKFNVLDNILGPQTPLYRVDRLLIGSIFGVLWTAVALVSVATSFVEGVVGGVQEFIYRLAARIGPDAAGKRFAIVGLPLGAKEDWYGELFADETSAAMLGALADQIPPNFRQGVASLVRYGASWISKDEHGVDSHLVKFAKAFAPEGYVVAEGDESEIATLRRRLKACKDLIDNDNETSQSAPEDELLDLQSLPELRHRALLLAVREERASRTLTIDDLVKEFGEVSDAREEDGLLAALERACRETMGYVPDDDELTEKLQNDEGDPDEDEDDEEEEDQEEDDDDEEEEE